MAKSLVSCFLTHGVYCPNKIFAEAILSNSTRKLSWFEITKMLTAVSKKNVALFIILFGTLSFHIVQFTPACLTRHRQDCLVVSGGRCELRITVRTADAYTRDTILQCRPNCKVYRVLTVGLYVYIYSLCADEDVLKPLCLALWEVTWSTVLFSPAVATLLPRDVLLQFLLLVAMACVCL